MLSPLRSLENFGLLALRVAVATSFLVHGMQKWGMWSAPPAEMSSGMVALFRLLAVVEPLGAVAVLLGFLTPLAAAGLGIIMLGAIYFKMFVFGAGFSGGWELDLVLLSICVALVTAGAGAWSLDALWGKSKKK